MKNSKRKYSFYPAYHPDCRVLILGSLPGDESLRQGQYYAHARNAFWQIMTELLGIPREAAYEERIVRLNAAGVALWDVVASARRFGSLDVHMEKIAPNDIPWLVRQLPSLTIIGCNGAAAYRILKQEFPALWEAGNPEIRQLPSTSPAAAAISYQEKRAAFAALLRAGGVAIADVSVLTGAASAASADSTDSADSAASAEEQSERIKR